MPIYTLSAVDGSIYEEQASDGAVEKMIDLTIVVLRDDTEVGRFRQRVGYEMSNPEIRDVLLARVREIVMADYESLEQQAESARLAAIQANIEVWSRSLP
jgi:hypothetical protein